MTETLSIGRRLVPLEHIALIEPFDPSQANIESDKSFQTRIVLINRESVLTEEALAAFAEKHAFRMLAEDGIGLNPAVHFSVEAFEPGEGFNPTRNYKSRLLWKDQQGQSRSKLLLTPPESALAVAVRGVGAPALAGLKKQKKSPRKRARTDPAPT